MYGGFSSIEYAERGTNYANGNCLTIKCHIQVTGRAYPK
jgi:hypothetical protein